MSLGNWEQKIRKKKVRREKGTRRLKEGRKERMWRPQERKAEEVEAREQMEAMSSFVMTVATSADGSPSRLASPAPAVSSFDSITHTRTHFPRILYYS